LWTSEPLRLEAGSWRIGATSGVATIGMFMFAAPACIWIVARSARTGRIGIGWLAAVSTLMVLSPLSSAQFAGWLAPGAAIAWAEADRAPALIGARRCLDDGPERLALRLSPRYAVVGSQWRP
jgi:hypothetical protein